MLRLVVPVAIVLALPAAAVLLVAGVLLVPSMALLVLALGRS